MALTALMRISNAKGESIITTNGDENAKEAGGNYRGWIELQGWDWDVEAETSWTKGGGASVGKPNPGKMNWEHYYDSSSSAILRNIFGGQAFEKVEMHMLKSTGKQGLRVFFKMVMSGAFITKVSNSATEEGNIVQKVEMVFKEVEFHYWQQVSTGPDAGTLKDYFNVKWDIPAGTVK